MSEITTRSDRASLLKPVALANGTIPSLDLAESKRFYEDVLGLDVAEHPKGLLIRLGGDHSYLVEQVQPAHQHDMILLNHNGFYLHPDETVEGAHAKLAAVKEAYGIRQLTQPNWQHGYHAFFLQDRDGNWWEFHHAPTGPRRDLSNGPPMTTEDMRSWFNARRRERRGAPEGE